MVCCFQIPLKTQTICGQVLTASVPLYEQLPSEVVLYPKGPCALSGDTGSVMVEVGYWRSAGGSQGCSCNKAPPGCQAGPAAGAEPSPHSAHFPEADSCPWAPVHSPRVLHGHHSFSVLPLLPCRQNR